MAASTPRTCLRSESDSVHSQNSSQASSRVGEGTRAGYGARKRIVRRDALRYPCAAVAGPDRGGSTHGEIHHRRRQPLSGTVVPAGNKNAALPVLAATLLTEEEVVLRNIPRIRDVEAMVGPAARAGGHRRVARATTCWPCAPPTRRGGARPGADRADPRLLPAGRPAAGPLRLGPHAAPGRRRDRPPAPGSPPGRLPRAGRRRWRAAATTASPRPPGGCGRATSSWTSRR